MAKRAFCRGTYSCLDRVPHRSSNVQRYFHDLHYRLLGRFLIEGQFQSFSARSPAFLVLSSQVSWRGRASGATTRHLIPCTSSNHNLVPWLLRHLASGAVLPEDPGSTRSIRYPSLVRPRADLFINDSQKVPLSESIPTKFTSMTPTLSTRSILTQQGNATNTNGLLEQDTQVQSHTIGSDMIADIVIDLGSVLLARSHDTR